MFFSRVQKVNFFLKFKRLILISSHGVRVKSSKDHYYLVLKIEDRVLDKRKRKKIAYIRK